MGERRYYEFGDYRLDVRERRLMLDGVRIPLTGKQLGLLEFLVRNPGILFSREALSSGAWPGANVSPGTVNVHLSALKKALGETAYQQFIENERGEGYRFRSVVTSIEEEEVPALHVEKRRLSARVVYEEEEVDEDGSFSPGTVGPALEATIALATPKPDSLSDQSIGSDGAFGSPQARPLPPCAEGQPGSRFTSRHTRDRALIPAEALHQSHVQTVRSSKLWKWIALAMLAGMGLTAILSLATYSSENGSAISLSPATFRQLTNDGCKKTRGLPILADGARVYFWEYRRTGMVLASVPVAGGEVAEVPIPKGFVATDISKNGSEFLGADATPAGAESLAILPTSSESVHWLMQPPEPRGPHLWTPLGSWSARGNRIVFAMRNDVFEAGADGSGMRKVAHLDGWASWPRWCPDGRRLCFSVLKPKAERYVLWEMNGDGTHLHPLTFPGNRFTETRWGNWTPDGKYLIFEAVQGGRYDIWAARERGAWVWTSKAKPVRLTSGPLNYYSPVPSHDGKEIFVLGEESRGELMRFDLKSHAFVVFLGGISAAEVNFSRDGEWVTYVTYPDYTLWRAHSDGSDALQLTYPPLEAREPHWSPDGQQIAFQGISPGARYKIYLVSSAGGLVRDAVPGSGEESVATWWPDGQSLLYDEPLYRHDVSQMFIHRLDLRTGKTSRIPASGGTWTARLSPDGRYIATLDATPAADPRHLIIFETKTGRRDLTLTMRDHLSEPSWSRDGKYVYFATIGSSAPALYRASIREKKVELLTSLGGFPVAGLWTGVAPDGSPLLLRDISTEELYALRVRLP